MLFIVVIALSFTAHCAGNSCRPETTFHDAVLQITKFHLHRLWIVDGSQKLVNVLTVGDVLRRFYDTASAQAK